MESEDKVYVVKGYRLGDSVIGYGINKEYEFVIAYAKGNPVDIADYFGPMTMKIANGIGVAPLEVIDVTPKMADKVRNLDEIIRKAERTQLKGKGKLKRSED